MSILWSDDCLSCLCNFSHTLEEHTKAVERAWTELQSQGRELERKIREVVGDCEQDEEGEDDHL